jgi:uncharacterized HhH-GPD family protein
MQGTLYITGDPDADTLLNTDPFALLLGMMLDQQVPMEKAFSGPGVLVGRLAATGGLDPKAIVDAGPEALAAAFAERPAIHRFPGSMATRAYALCEYLVEHHGGDTETLWRGVDDGAELYRRIRALPGFGDEKAKIFLALLGKRFGVQPAGWREAAGSFGDDVPRSIADVDGPESLAKVRVWKKARKAEGKSKQD